MKRFTMTLVRHGESSANVSHMLSGCMNVMLTEHGRKELEDLRDSVDYGESDIYFSSPLQRCIDTFHILFHDKTPIIKECFHEIDFRSLEGWVLSTKEEMKAYFDSWVKDEGYLDEETFSDVAERARPAILDTVTECMDKGLGSATVVMHSGIMRVSIVTLFNLPPETFNEMTVPNGLGYRIEFEDGHPVSYRKVER